MKFSIQRENLLKPLQAAINIVEKRNVIPILAHVLLRVQKDLTITATNSENEIIATTNIDKHGKDGIVSVPARKLFEITRSLPEGSDIKLTQNGNRVVVNSARSRFVLSTLNAKEFPFIESDFTQDPIEIPQGILLRTLRRTNFAMAQQDVRYFLNGMLFEVNDNNLSVVATDGHRLAMASQKLAKTAVSSQVIVPRKAVLELMRMLQDSDDPVEVCVGTNHIRAMLPAFTFTSKLLDGLYPDYNCVIPSPPGDNVMVVDRDNFKQALSRAAILSNEKHRGVRLCFANNLLKIEANNPEQEQAEDEIEIEYSGQKMEIGFNVGYLLDVLNVIDSDKVEMRLSNANSSVLICDTANKDSTYVVMPIRL